MSEKIRESDYGDNNCDIIRRDQVLSVNMTYPGYTESDNPMRVRVVEINQESVRASDGVRISYDYNRDGWSIMQPKVTEVLVEETPHGNSYRDDEEWIETAFVGSWAFDRDQNAI